MFAVLRQHMLGAGDRGRDLHQGGLPGHPALTELAPGVTVRSVVAGPFEELDKTICTRRSASSPLRCLGAEAAAEPGRYDLMHAHYWLSGKVGAAAKERWGVPLVQSMHTLGKVKNAALAAGDAAEPDCGSAASTRWWRPPTG